MFKITALGTMVIKGDEDENVEICCDEDEELKLGPPQYHQEDLAKYVISLIALHEKKLEKKCISF